MVLVKCYPRSVRCANVREEKIGSKICLGNYDRIYECVQVRLYITSRPVKDNGCSIRSRVCLGSHLEMAVGRLEFQCSLKKEKREIRASLQGSDASCHRRRAKYRLTTFSFPLRQKMWIQLNCENVSVDDRITNLHDWITYFVAFCINTFHIMLRNS